MRRLVLERVAFGVVIASVVVWSATVVHGFCGFYVGKADTKLFNKASQVVLAAYPVPVRNWIRRRGGLTEHMLVLRGRDLAAMYPGCR